LITVGSVFNFFRLVALIYTIFIVLAQSMADK